MRIYLDSCVFQDLKKEEGQNLMSLILNSKGKNIYCFSEAHLYDLRRDKSSEKYTDMELMETIVENNCFYYDKKINFEHLTPKEYFGRYDWTEYQSSLLTGEDDFSTSIQTLFKSIPLKFTDFFSIDQLPLDCPDEFKELLTHPTTLYEFALSFLSFTEDLSSEQKRFKNFVSYLHKNSLIPNIHELVGIKGFDGEKIVDKDLFLETYTAYYLKNTNGKYRYNLFIDMYTGLEFWGFVKGKPKKQKMMNLINDARHAFFGGFCDIVVSKDDDFLNKTKFIYSLHDVETLVLHPSEFCKYLSELASTDDTFYELLSEMDIVIEKEVVEKWEDENENKRYALKYLNSIHWGYFNTITFVQSPDIGYLYFSKKINNFSTGTLMKEFLFITKQMISELGEDLDKRKEFRIEEINKENETWEGRRWVVGNTLINLNYNKKMYIMLHPLISDKEAQ